MGASASVQFVGRTDEYAELVSSVAEIALGRSRVVVIEGEAGIGKSRLLEEFLGGIGGSTGITVLRSRALELERNRPFGAIADALEVGLRSTGRQHRAVAEMLWGPPDTFAEDVDAVATGPERRFRILEAIQSLVEQLVATAPLVLAVDDVHWCDSSSLLALNSLSRRLAHLPLGLILTVRPLPRSTEAEHALDGLLADGGVHLLLGPLDDADVEALAQTVTGHPPGQMLRHQLRRARGNPLFVIELLRALEAEGGLVVEGGEADVATTTLPSRLHVMLLRRLSYLSRETLDLLRLASVLGSTFEVAHLALVARRSVVDLLPLLDEAIRAGVVADAGARLAFRHDLVRESIYNDLVPGVRRSLHHEVGHILAEAGAPAFQVAEHLSFDAAPGDAPAVRWLHDAARESMSRAPADAISLLERAIAVQGNTHPGRVIMSADLAVARLWAGRVLESEEQARVVLAADHDAAVDAVVRQALIIGLISQGRTIEATSEAAIALQQDGLPAEARARLRAYAAYGPLFSGDLDAAATLAETAWCEGDRLGDAMAASLGLNALGMVATMQARVADAVGIATVALQRADSAPGSAGYRWQSSVTLAVALMDADRFAEAESVLVEGRHRCENFGVRWPLPLYQWALLWLSFRRGEWDATAAEAEAGFRLVDQVDFRFGAVSAHSALAMIAVHRNDLAGAERRLAAGGAELAASGPQYLFEWRLWATALLEEARDRRAAAVEALEEAWAILTGGGVRVGMAEIGVDLVRLLVLEGNDRRASAVAAEVENVAACMGTASARGNALRCRGLAQADVEPLREAVDVLQGSPRPVLLARACEETAALLVRGGAVQEALDLLHQAARVWERVGASRDLARVEAALRSMGPPPGRRGTRRRPQVGWDSLTRTETDVVRLAVEGLTNREIGARLYLSPRTAETHLRHVYAKLGVASRRELTREAALRLARQSVPPAHPSSPPTAPASRQNEPSGRRSSSTSLAADRVARREGGAGSDP